jgi:hypothetical protein
MKKLLRNLTQTKLIQTGPKGRFIRYHFDNSFSRYAKFVAFDSSMLNV